MVIEYSDDAPVTPEQMAEVFIKSGIRRPAHDFARMAQMIEHADLTVTAWDGERLVGIARCLTDFCFACYLSDLAVDRDYQKQGIGKELVARVSNVIGENTALILLSAQEAMDYYPKIGFTKAENAWMIGRKG